MFGMVGGMDLMRRESRGESPETGVVRSDVLDA